MAGGGVQDWERWFKALVNQGKKIGTPGNQVVVRAEFLTDGCSCTDSLTVSQTTSCALVDTAQADYSFACP